MYRNILIHIKMRFTDLDHFLLLLFIMSSLLHITCGADNPKYTIQVNSTISVQRGLCVYIPCTFTVGKGPTAKAYGTWYKGDEKGEVVSSQNPSLASPINRGRIFFTGDATKLDCSMSMNDVQPSDGDTPYLFRFVDADGGSYSYYNYKITLNVIELTEKPVITQMENLLAGKEVTLTCQSPGRCNGSAPLISWSGGVQGTDVTYPIVDPDGNRTYYSNITFTPSKQDHNSSLTCTVNFQASSTSTYTQIHLNVQYPPSVIITVKDNIQNESTSVIVKEGDSETIRCMVDSNPESTIIWTKEDTTLPATLNGQTSTYNVMNATVKDAGKYRCSAKNSLRTITRSVNITVHYAPRKPQIDCFHPKDCLIDGNKTISMKEGSSLSLQCSAESLPQAELEWSTSNKNQENVNTNQTGKISISKILPSHNGSYICHAKNDLGNSSASVTIKVTVTVTSLPEKSSLGMILAVSVVLVVSVILGIAFIILQYYRRRKLIEESKDRKELTSNSHDVIYSNSSVFCNNDEISQEIPKKNLEQDDRTVYMNCEDVQYASIDFARMKPKPSMEVTEPETEYAIIKPN